MSEPKPGAALTDALKAREQRKGNRNAAANAAKERMFVGQSEMTVEENEQVQPKLKAEFLAREMARNPHFLGTS